MTSPVNDGAAMLVPRRKNYRAYRGSLAVTKSEDFAGTTQAAFKDYHELKDIDADQRIGAILPSSGNAYSMMLKPPSVPCRE